MLLLFLEPRDCGPSSLKLDRYKTDYETNAVKIYDEAYIHIEFDLQVRFFFSQSQIPGENLQDDSPLGSLEAIVTEEEIKLSNSSINVYAVPITTPDRQISGYMRFKLSNMSTYHCILSQKLDWSRPSFIGHRGFGSNQYGRKVMENTLMSFNLAMAASGGKLAGIELDVTLTSDEQLVVYHDLEYPIFIGGNHRPVAIPSLRYADMCRPKLNRSESCPSSSYPEAPSFISEDCPLLETVLQNLIPISAGLVIELKYPTNKTISKCPDLGKFSRSDLVHMVLDCLKNNAEFTQERWIALSSFDPDIVWMLRTALAGTSPNVTVIHNCWFGNEREFEDSTVDFGDIRNRSPEAADAQRRKLGTGIAMETTFVLSDSFHQFISDVSCGPILTYGAGNLDKNNIEKQTRVSAFFIDDMRIISPNTQK